MDYEPIEGSSSSHNPATSSSTAPLHTTERTLRSSTRVKAGREREEKEIEDSTTDNVQQPSSSSRNLRTRANTVSQASSQKPLREPSLAKGKGKELVADSSGSRSTKRLVTIVTYSYSLCLISICSITGLVELLNHLRHR